MGQSRVRQILNSRFAFLVVIAMVVAVTTVGSASAAKLITSGDIKDGTIKGKDIEKATITTSRIQANALGSKKIADKSIEVRDMSDAAVDELTGGAVKAYAAVTDQAQLVTARTKGFTAVVRPSTGIYCLTLDDSIDPTKSAPVVSVMVDAATAGPFSAFVNTTPTGCPAGADFAVRTYALNAGVNEVSNLVGFTVLVP